MAYDIAKIRADFPLLNSKVYGKELVYLDSGATAQKPLSVIEKVDYLHLKSILNGGLLTTKSNWRSRRMRWRVKRCGD